MNELLQGAVIGLRLPGALLMPHLPVLLGQTNALPPRVDLERPNNFLNNFSADLGSSVVNLVQAVVILVVGWLVAWIAAALVRSLLKRTNLDNKLAGWVSGQPTSRDNPPIEKWVSAAVFWLIFIFALVAFLQALQLTAVSEPLNRLLTQVMGYLPALAGAALLLVVAWVLATIVKALVTRLLRAFRIDERLSEQVDTPPPSPSAVDASSPTGTAAPPPGRSPFSLSDTIGNTLYWFIFLLFLPAILNTLGLQGTLEPVQDLLDDILGILPNVFAAVLIGVAGWLVAQVVRRIVTNFLMATGADQVGSRFGLSTTHGSQSLSWIAGTIVYVLILIPTAIAALNALQIEAISQPAIAMLNDILAALPRIFTAAVILIAAYAIGRFVADLITNVLTGLGFNRIFDWIGLPSLSPPTTTVPAVDPATGRLTPPASAQKTPSEVVGIIAWVGIILFALVAAINVLEIEALTALVTGVVLVSGRVLAGVIVFAIGLYFANLAFRLISSSGGRQARILAQSARIAIVILVAAMALQQIGVASNIVNLAFGLLFGAFAVAIAIAFGLGGRDVAAEQLREWLTAFKRQ